MKNDGPGQCVLSHTKNRLYYELNYIEVLIPNVTVFGDRPFMEEIRLYELMKLRP